MAGLRRSSVGESLKVLMHAKIEETENNTEPHGRTGLVQVQVQVLGPASDVLLLVSPCPFRLVGISTLNTVMETGALLSGGCSRTLSSAWRVRWASERPGRSSVPL